MEGTCRGPREGIRMGVGSRVRSKQDSMVGAHCVRERTVTGKTSEIDRDEVTCDFAI